ncbi:MAG: PAS domain-containing sensor histidine kinase, partial [Deltaproteobacteria bacterium]|nr:PAS domain-containing sensor histidine kinase [Deltaproteobacteria bacterium]
AAKMATLGEMSAGVAHELNQPLSVLATGGHLLARQTQKGAPPDPALVAQVAREIEEQVGRATRIINHLREFGRKAEVSRSLIDVTEPIAGVFQLLGQQMRVHDIAVHLDLPAGLPPVWADKNRMEQVFINLLLNARDAIDERRQAGDRRGGEISVAAREENGQAVVMVRDNGIGIPPALRSRIFEPFFTTKEVGRGTGLGLSISYGIVRDYGGTITVESCPGQGSCFRVSFPLAAEEAA